MLILAFFLLIFGVITATFPFAGWYLSIGWKFKNAEPSDFALTMQRIGGVISSIIGIIIIVSSIYNLVEINSWVEDFKSKLTSDNVTSIKIRLGGSPLTDDQEKEVITIIQDAEIYHTKDFNNFGGYYTTLEITFKDGSNESIGNMGNDFEILKNNVKYLFSSEELNNWISEYEKEDS